MTQLEEMRDAALERVRGLTREELVEDMLAAGWTAQEIAEMEEHGETQRSP